ncbi:MAG: radical SAM protein, partial [Clostridia bacterium]|nr:radical SAM protein [Clostridia bacterium]
MRFKRVYIEITNVCNLKCEFCLPHHRENKFMTFEEFDTILQKIKPYTKYIYLHVKGEPLMHPEVDKFIEYAYENGFYVNLTTNGTLLEKHLSITKNLRQINISLHATND